MEFTNYEKIATIVESYFLRHKAEGKFGRAVDVSKELHWLARIEVTDGPSVLVRRDSEGRWEVFSKGFVAVGYDIEDAARVVLQVTSRVVSH